MAQEMIAAYKAMFANFTNFNGKTNRRNFWLAVLANFIVSFIVGFVSGLISLPIVGTIYALVMMIPSLAMEIRRMHDINKSGWNLLLSLIPLVGFIIVIYLFCQPSVANDKYGAEV